MSTLSPLAALKLARELQNCRMSASQAKMIAEVIIHGLDSEPVLKRIGTLGVAEAARALNSFIEGSQLS